MLMIKMHFQLFLFSDFEVAKTTHCVSVFIDIILTCDTKAVISSTGIFVAIDNNTLYWFSFMPKFIRILRSCSMKIFCKFPTINVIFD